MLNQSGMRVLVAVAGATGPATTGRWSEQVRGDCPGLREVVYLGRAELGRRWSRGAAAVPAERLAERGGGAVAATTRSTSSTPRAPPGSPRAPRCRTTTSSTTATSWASWCGYTEQDRVCLPVPFYHCFGMVMGNLGATTHGACIIIPAPAFDPAATLRAVAAERCHLAVRRADDVHRRAGPARLRGLRPVSLRTGIMAGSPCPVEVMKRVIAEMHMAEVAICYGMTETSPVSTQTRRDDDLERRTATVGRVLPHIEVKVVDPATGVTVPRGEPGELCTRGYSRDARLLERAGEDRRGDRRRRAGCTPATWR